MVTTNRAAVLTKIHKVLKKHYQPVAPVRERTLLENLLYACCLEDASFEVADECFARLQESYFDWNEVRVTTIRELGAVFHNVANAATNASNLKHTLQSVFESQYSFDLDHLTKQNLGKAVALLGKYRGTTQFTIAYATQTSLGGHAIPLGKGGTGVMYILGAIDEKEVAAGNVPGLERAIPKSQGVEFASLLHHLAAALLASPFSTRVRSILLEIDPDCKARLPKRVDKKKLAEEQKKQAAARKEAARKEAADRAAATKASTKKTPTKKAAEKKATGKQAPREKVAKKVKTEPKTKTRATSEKQTRKKGVKTKAQLVQKATQKGKKSASKQLARRKPR